MSRYKVAPFSGARYTENAARCDVDELPCAICGKPVRHGASPHAAIVVNGGVDWGDEHSDPDDAGFMGSWPVGRDCHRKHVVREA